MQPREELNSEEKEARGKGWGGCGGSQAFEGGVTGECNGRITHKQKRELLLTPRGDEVGGGGGGGNVAMRPRA